ncbi:unnamed protein product [Ascophyllum nodosum]
MRVAFRRQHPSHTNGRVPDFLVSELKAAGWEQTGFDVDFPAMFNDPDVAAAMGYKGRNFAVDSIDIVRWYNRETKVTTGSVMFSEECEGPPGNVHGGAVASALDDILGTMVWRNAGFSSAGIPTLELTVTYRDPVPLQRQLRFDTEVVKWEGRKTSLDDQDRCDLLMVFGKVSLRDPYSGKLLAEAKGLFYLKKPATPLPDANNSNGAGATKQLQIPGAGAAKTTAGPPRDLPCIIPYEEALRRFGKSNPRASANLVEFYRGQAAATPRAKL